MGNTKFTVHRSLLPEAQYVFSPIRTWNFGSSEEDSPDETIPDQQKFFQLLSVDLINDKSFPGNLFDIENLDDIDGYKQNKPLLLMGATYQSCRSGSLAIIQRSCDCPLNDKPALYQELETMLSDENEDLADVEIFIDRVSNPGYVRTGILRYSIGKGKVVSLENPEAILPFAYSFSLEAEHMR